MQKKLKNGLGVGIVTLMIAGCSISMNSNKEVQKPISPIESPNASEIIKKDLLKQDVKVEMPTNCVTEDTNSIKRGSIFFNELSNASGKYKEYSSEKQFGNCVACHNIEKAVGNGNIGPDLTNYNEYAVKSGVRSHEWIFKKIADPRIDNPETAMTVNLVNGLFTEREICDIVSYLVSKK
jgi:sulfur-oxidizing protein SoxX